MIKKKYEKPSMVVYHFPKSPALLTVSGNDGNNPFNWGVPGDDE